MPPTPFQPVDIPDVWIRVLTDESYWKKNGTLHNSAFGGKAISPPQEQRSWSLEFSGRLLSLVVSVEEESAQFCNHPRVFAGIMYQSVENLRTSEDLNAVGCNTDVIFTPLENDTAHSDLVAFGPTAENKFLIRDWLQDFIQYVRPSQCAVLEALRSAA